MIQPGTKILVAGRTKGTVRAVLPHNLCSIEVHGEIMLIPADKIADDDEDLARHPAKTFVIFHG